MLDNFRSYQLARELYKKCKTKKLPYYLKDQLNRAAGSIMLNLSEGSARVAVTAARVTPYFSPISLLIDLAKNSHNNDTNLRTTAIVTIYK